MSIPNPENRIKLLIFNYYWPPSGGSAVQRWLSLVKLLQLSGIDSIVVTVDEKYASYSLFDESLEQEIPDQVKVVKTRTREILQLYRRSLGKGSIPTAGFANEPNPGFLKQAARWVRGNLFIPDPRKGWNRFALKAAREIIKKEKPDILVSAGPPHSTHLICLALQQEFNIPWIADFHDAWTNIWYYDKLLKTNWAKAIDASFERKVIENADLILTVGQGIKDDFEKKIPGLPKSKIMLHSMGYDDALFAKRAPVPTDVFIITYTGTMASNYQPQAFFQALRLFLDTKPAKPVKLKLVGLMAEECVEMAKHARLESYLELVPYQPHHIAVRLLRESCLLLLVNPDTPQAEMIIPGKLYEYMATGIPILNLATHKSESSRIIDRCKAGKTFERTDTEAIHQFIQGIYTQWLVDPNSILNHDSEYERYSRKNESIQLASAIRRLL